MKKTLLQFGSLTGFIVLILTIVGSTGAQTQYRAHIPFDFTVKNKIYKAGDFSIDVLNPNSPQKPIAIRESRSRKSQILMMTPGEDYSKVETATIAFVWNEGQYSLSVISTPAFIVRLATTGKAKETLARNQNTHERLVALTKKN